MIGMSDPPVSMGKVTLVVHDLDQVCGFYRETVGLHLVRQDPGHAELGVEGVVLLALRRDAGARRHSPRDAGLFHTAFLLPNRAALGAWTKFAAQSRARIVGAADHGVSEALYLADPEGNGVEIYADRPQSSWRWKDGFVEMPSDPLDVASLVAAAGERTWKGFVPGAAVGHVHLQVGDIAPAEAFYAGVLGLDVTCRYPGGTFYAAGGYHHHLATNVWNSRGAGVRTEPSTGLAELEVNVSAQWLKTVRPTLTQGNEMPARLTLDDPWGTDIVLSIR